LLCLCALQSGLPIAVLGMLARLRGLLALRVP
jgi:hypothetical protein